MSRSRIDAEPTGEASPSRRRRRRSSRRQPNITIASVVGTVLVVAGVIADQYRSFGHVANWDWLLVSGSLTFLAGLWLARSQLNRFCQMLTRLQSRRAFWHLDQANSDEGFDQAITDEEFRVLEGDLVNSARRWGRPWAVSFAVVLAAVWGAVLVPRGWINLLAFVEVAMGFVAGWFVGHFLRCSRLGQDLKGQGITLHAVPGHVDGAAGLKPVGSYFLYQALVLAIPAAFLITWSFLFLIPRWSSRYSAWRSPYLALCVVAVGIEVLGFVTPLWGVHRTMQKQKHDHFREADAKLAPRIVATRQELTEAVDTETRSQLHGLINDLTARYHDIDAMPTWPLDRTILRQITIGNLVLVVPLVGKIVATAASWTKF